MKIKNMLTILLVTITACILAACNGEKNSSSTIVPSSEPSTQSTTPINPITEPTCTYDIRSLKGEISEIANGIIDNWTGNIWQNANLGEAIFKAERITENPNCEKEAKAIGLPESIAFGNKVRAIGEARVKRSLELAKELQPK